MRGDGDAESVSEHGDAGAATQAAVKHAGRDRATDVLVHDLYSRVHPVTPSGRRTRDSHRDH